ncbi:MAG: hypothetical protein FWH02_05970 [Oscillospiraceae bacterium]|nr:hypothetical protein [Oscillospiraceae bacterium]
MPGRPRCPACKKDGIVQPKELRIRGVYTMTFGFTCSYCGYQAQSMVTERELFEGIEQDKIKIESFARRPKDS